ncbi:MAG: hypothetical protein SFY81_00290, partial [Verrucomicrobiota bacterium]|nr:hypothetical protein [Verrucomicrobiota bacterium]
MKIKAFIAIIFATFLAIPSEAANRKLVMVAGSPSHPPGMHEFTAGSILLKKRLEQVKGLTVTFHTNGWPADPQAFEGA